MGSESGLMGKEKCEEGRRKERGEGGEKGVREKGKDRARWEVNKARCVQCVRYAWKTDSSQALDDVPSSSHLRGYMKILLLQPLMRI